MQGGSPAPQLLQVTTQHEHDFYGMHYALHACMTEFIAVSEKGSLLQVKTEPQKLVKAAGLHYVCDDRPGIRRRRAGGGFVYVGPDNKAIHDRKVLSRIRSLVIPPAWENVWICLDPNGHLQATGRDAKGRKQYRYHERWHEVRSETKYFSLLAFGEALPAIREQTENDLRKQGLPKEKVLGTVVRLLESTLIRIGNEEYMKANESYGLTTLRDEHVNIKGAAIHFSFRGKSGVYHEIKVTDKRLARIIKRCQDLPGYELFQYVDDEGQTRTIESADVNEYLAHISCQNFSAKDFRTWGGTILTAKTLYEIGPAESATELKRNIVQAIKTVSSQLGNRPAVCRSYYVHPAVLQAYEDRSLFPIYEHRLAEDAQCRSHLRPEEEALLDMLKKVVGISI